MVQFFSHTDLSIDDEAAREGDAIRRLRRRTGGREILVAEKDRGFHMGGAKSPFRRYRYDREACAAALAGKAKKPYSIVTQSDLERRARQRERIALRAKIIAQTAHLPADEARAICEKLLRS